MPVTVEKAMNQMKDLKKSIGKKNYSKRPVSEAVKSSGKQQYTTPKMKGKC